MSIAVEFKSVSKSIKKKKIIHDFDITIAEGEIFGLLGPNGAGKTTLIRMLTGLIHMDQGDIFICSHSIKNANKQAIQKLGALVEQPVFYPYLSGYDNLRIFANMNENVSDKYIDELIETVGLSNKIKSKVQTYSLGMKQRLGIAVALIRNPKVLILDEPTNGLDPEGIKEIRSFLKKLAKEKGVTVLVSSHMLSEMNLLCDRFAIIANGRLLRTVSQKEFMDGNGVTQYRIEVDNALKAFAISKDKYKNVNMCETYIYIEGNKEELASLIENLVKNEVKIYQAQEMGNPLERLYFEAIGMGKEGISK